MERRVVREGQRRNSLMLIFQGLNKQNTHHLNGGTHGDGAKDQKCHPLGETRGTGARRFPRFDVDVGIHDCPLILNKRMTWLTGVAFKKTHNAGGGITCENKTSGGASPRRSNAIEK